RSVRRSADSTRRHGGCACASGTASSGWRASTSRTSGSRIPFRPRRAGREVGGRMSGIARVLFPALRWAERTGFDHESARIDEALRIGVGGFILFGGDAGTVRDLAAELRGRSAPPLLIGADLERGAGQQFRGATQLPPAAALADLDDLEVTRRAGELTARE